MSDTKVFDPWELSSGLPDDFNGKVQDQFFGTDAEYNDGKTLILKLEVLTDDPEIGEAGVTTLMFPCGTGWEAMDNGKRCQREDGKDKKFNVQSGVGLLVKHAIEAGAGDVLKGKGTPMHADIWHGMDFHWQRKEFSWKDGGETRTYNRTLPVKYNGVGGGPVASSPSTSAAPAAASTPSAASNGSPAIDGKVKAKLRVLAREIKTAGGTHDTFVERAFGEVEGVNGDAAAEDAVMAYAAGSIWDSTAAS